MSARALRGGDAVAFQNDPDLASQEVEKNRDTFGIPHAFKQADAGCECAVKNSNGIPRRKTRFRKHDETVFLAIAQLCNDRF
jgi:hypothetical protein